MSRADRRGMKGRRLRPSSAVLPRSVRATCRSLGGDIRTKNEVASYFIADIPHLFLRVRVMALERARRCKFAEPVPHHVFRHMDRQK